jgi:ribosomal protein S25
LEEDKEEHMKKRKKGKIKKAKIAYVEQGEFELLSLALRAVIEEKKVSCSFVQRRLKVGYSAAARLIDRLEELAVITPARGSDPRSLTGYVPILKIQPVPKVKVPVAKMDPEKKKTGRPSLYSKELAQKICIRIATGESVLQICRDDTMPEARTVYLWLLNLQVEDKKEFREMYEQAREIQSEVMHDELTEIADDGQNDWMEIETQRGRLITVPDHEHVNRSRLRVDTRKWILARMNPRKYGEKLDLTTKGKEFKQSRPAVINYVVPTKPKQTA